MLIRRDSNCRERERKREREREIISIFKTIAAWIIEVLTVTSLPQHIYSTTTTQFQHNHNTITSKSQHNHSTISTSVFPSPSPSLFPYLTCCRQDVAAWRRVPSSPRSFPSLSSPPNRRSRQTNKQTNRSQTNVPPPLTRVASPSSWILFLLFFFLFLFPLLLSLFLYYPLSFTLGQIM